MNPWYWIDMKTYVDYDKIDQARVLYKEELDIFLSDYNNINEVGMDLDTMYNTGVKDNWKSLPIINSDPEGVRFPEHFPKTYEIVKNCRGVVNFSMNFTLPHSVIVPHQDPYDVIDGVEIAHYNCLAGVVIPSNDINKCGMKFGEEEKFLHEGEWFCFHPDIVHEAWNRTDQHRLTLITTIDRRYFK